MTLDNPSRPWLAALEVGAEVVVYARGHRTSKYVRAKVERTTATQLVVRYGGGSKRFRRNDGREVGNIYGPFRLLELTPHIADEVEKERINLAFDKAVGGVGHRCPLTTEERLVMVEALEAYRARKP